MRTGKVLEDSWAALRAVARKWEQLDKGPQSERDEELEAELQLLLREDDDDNDSAEEGDEDRAEVEEVEVEVNMPCVEPPPTHASY